MPEQYRGDETPFKDILEDAGIAYQSRLKKVSINPEKVIRLEVLNKEKNSTVADTHKAKRLFEELEGSYGIKVPVSFMVGPNETGEDAIYAITDKIHGNDLDHLPRYRSEEKEVLIEKLEKLYLSWMHYFGDKYKNGEAFLWDIAKNSQYVYGTRKGEKVLDIYLVDTDPLFTSGKGRMLSSLMIGYSDVIKTERSIGVTFKKVHDEFSRFIKTLSEEEKKYVYRYLSLIDDL